MVDRYEIGRGVVDYGMYVDGAWHFASVVGSSCHTFDPARIDQAQRIRGSVRDFARAPDRILDRDA